MIKFLDNKKAKEIWNTMILNMSNTTYYQSYDYALAYRDDSDLKFIYDTEKKIFAFAKVDDEIKIPFGPIIGNDVTSKDIMDFVVEVSEYIKKNVIFSVSNSKIDEINSNYSNLEKTWLFVTPIIDTRLSIDEIVKNCTKNRQRIIKKGLENIQNDRIKEGIEYLDDFCNLYKKRMSETGGEVDFNKDSLEKCLYKPTSHLVVCLDSNKVIAGHMIFMFGNTVITRFNCFDSDYYKISPSARIEYELIKRSCEDSSIDYYDMSGLAYGEDVPVKNQTINRYKESYNPTIIYKYQWYKYNREA